MTYPAGPAPVPAAGPPPPGPGVQPPFVAAPIEGRRARIGLGLALAGGLLAACCGVAVVAGAGLVVLSEQALNEQAQRAVDDYLAAVVDEEWEEAYELRCQADRDRETLAAFTRRVSEPPIASYRLGDLEIEVDEDAGAFDSGDMTVPVEVSYADGSAGRLVVPVAQDETGQIEVCEAAG